MIWNRNDKALPFTPHNFNTKVVYDEEAIPKVMLTAKAYNDMYILVDEADEEISWLGTVEEISPSLFLIDKVFLLKQKSNSTTTELEDAAIGDLGAEILMMEDGLKIANSLRFWGHSHHTMGTSPSAQDESQLKTFIEDNCEYFIRGILNKKGKIELTILFSSGVLIKDVPWMVMHEVSEEDREKWKEEISDKCEKITYGGVPAGGRGGWPGYNNGRSGYYNEYFNRVDDDDKSKKKNNGRSGKSATDLNNGHSDSCQCIHCQMERNGVTPFEYMHY